MIGILQLHAKKSQPQQSSWDKAKRANFSEDNPEVLIYCMSAPFNGAGPIAPKLVENGVGRKELRREWREAV